MLINITAIIVDVVPKHSLGSVLSVVVAGSTLGGIAMNTVVATIVYEARVVPRSGNQSRLLSPASVDPGCRLHPLVHDNGCFFIFWHGCWSGSAA
jgi:hypothetical protein